MSLLPSGQPLARLVPDLEDLLHDPRSYLGREPVVIGPRRMYGLFWLFALAGVAFLAYFALAKRDTEALALGIAMLVGSSVWLLWSLLLRGHSLTLHADGVEVCYRDMAVWCPWALFNVDGQAFVPEADSPRVGLTLPVAPDAVPFIELRLHGAVVAHGVEVKARQLQLAASDEVVLPARYEVRADELGELLLLLGRRLGRELPRGVPPPEAYRTIELDELPTPDAAGWITVSLTRLHFPAICCDCGEPTSHNLPLRVEAGSDWLIGQLTGTSGGVELPIPVCPACQARMQARQQRGGIQGIVRGAVVALGLTLLAALALGWQDMNTLAILGLGIGAAGGLAGFLVGTFSARRFPAQAARYSPSRGTLALRFRNPEYASLVRQAMQAHARDKML
jgi:hypothetical protein